MNEVRFGRTDLDLDELREEVDFKDAADILSSKKIEDPEGKIDRYLNRIHHKIQKLPSEGDRFPWRAENSPYRIYITEILLQRTHGAAVESIYDDFFRRFDSPSELWRAERNELRNEVESLGFQNRRPRCLKSVAEKLKENNFEIPEDRNELMEPWRVGSYAANATLLFGFDNSVELVDSNIASAAENMLNYPHSSAPHRDEDFRDLMRALNPASSDVARAFYFALIDFDFSS